MSRALSKIFFWTYPRGCWQYDLMCVAILAFIFLVPVSVLDGSAFDQARNDVPIQEHRARTEANQPDQDPRP